jgi:hypothetical protein
MRVGKPEPGSRAPPSQGGLGLAMLAVASLASRIPSERVKNLWLPVILSASEGSPHFISNAGMLRCAQHATDFGSARINPSDLGADGRSAVGACGR